MIIRITDLFIIINKIFFFFVSFAYFAVCKNNVFPVYIGRMMS